MHQVSADQSRAWFRCKQWHSHKCRATAIFKCEEGVIERITVEHNHGPLLLRDTAR